MKRVDLDLVCLDFAEAYARDPAQAAALALALLLDGPTCRARVAFLDALAGGAPPRGGDFSREIRLLCGVGLSRALRTGHLSPERLDALLADGDALLQAHAALVEEGPTQTTSGPPRAMPETAAQPFGDEPLGGFTDMFSQGRWPALEESLRPYIPAVLRFVGLERESAEAVLAFVLQKAQDDRTSKRFRDLLPVWLEEYARSRGLGRLPRPLRKEDWLAIVEQGAVYAVLSRQEWSEPDWAQQFRRAALAHVVRSWQDVERLAAPDRAGPAFAVFRRNLFRQVQHERDKAVALFELN